MPSVEGSHGPGQLGAQPGFPWLNGARSPGPGASCLSQDKFFAFVELRSVEETSNALARDNVTLKEGVHLKVWRGGEG